MTSTEESSVPNLKYYRPPKTRPQQEESAHRERVEQQGKTAINYAKIQAWGIVSAVIVGGLTLLVATLTLWAALGRQSFANQQGESHNTENQVDDENNHRSDLKF